MLLFQKIFVSKSFGLETCLIKNIMIEIWSKKILGRKENLHLRKFLGPEKMSKSLAGPELTRSYRTYLDVAYPDMT